MSSWSILLGSLLLCSSPLVSGHGNMVFPLTWWDKHQSGWYWDESGHNAHVGCGALHLPHTGYEDKNGNKPDCLNMWYTNGVKNPGQATIPEEVSQADVTCIGQAGHHDTKKEYPWNAPGTAPVFGSCGTLGGNPGGCDQDEFGDCCSDHCDGFAFGENAETYPWHNPPVTEWKAGSFQEVAWYCGANHAGGYSYRLCKIPHGGITHLTEECFQQNQLDFVGDTHWVNYGKDRKTGHRTEVPALQTVEGTFPAGSMWRVNPLRPHMEEGGSNDYGHGHIIDNVKVPNTLDTGEYVLSFRWDSKCSPQVWSSCANIRIV